MSEVDSSRSTSLQVSLTVDELAHAVLIKVFKLVGPLLGGFVQSVLKDVYGEEQWRRKAGDGLSKEMYSRLEKTRKQSLKDVYLVTELILQNLQVFLERFEFVGADESARLTKLALEVDRVSLTRTYLFHGVQVSNEDVQHCIHSLEKIWRGFSQLDAIASISTIVDQLRKHREVSMKPSDPTPHGTSVRPMPALKNEEPCTKNLPLHFVSFRKKHLPSRPSPRDFFSITSISI